LRQVWEAGAKETAVSDQRSAVSESAIGKSVSSKQLSVSSEQRLARRFFPVRLQNSPPGTSGKNFLLDAKAGNQ
jgi:hypothetical protein